METKNTHGGAGRGQGRKAGSPEDRTKQRAIQLTDEQWDHCFRQHTLGITASEYVRALIVADMKRVRADRG